MKIYKNGWIIKTVIASNEAIFDNGTCVDYPNKSTSETKIKILKEKNTNEKIEVKILLGQGANAPHFFIHEQTIDVSKFAFFVLD